MADSAPNAGAWRPTLTSPASLLPLQGLSQAVLLQGQGGHVSNTGQGMVVRHVQDQRLSQGHLLSAACQGAGSTSVDDLLHAQAHQGGLRKQGDLSLRVGRVRREVRRWKGSQQARVQEVQFGSRGGWQAARAGNAREGRGDASPRSMFEATFIPTPSRAHGSF